MIGAFTIDSSVFISCFIENDRFHKESVRFFDRLSRQKNPIIIPALVVCEVLHVLKKLAGSHDERISEINRSFMDTGRFKVISIDTTFIERFVKTRFKNNVKTSDAIILATAAFHKTTLISWDRQLMKNCKGLAAASTPDQI